MHENFPPPPRGCFCIPPDEQQSINLKSILGNDTETGLITPYGYFLISDVHVLKQKSPCGEQRLLENYMDHFR
jgi:hypothetical protein